MNKENCRVVKKGNIYKLFTVGTRKSVASIMLFNGKPEVVSAHWNVLSETAIEIYKALTV